MSRSLLLYYLALAFLLGVILLGSQQPAPVPHSPSDPVAPRFPVQWLAFPPLKDLHDPSWGMVLTDIENHLPASMGTQYRCSDPITTCHETTHGVHSHLNNTLNPPGDRSHYCLYPGNSQAVRIQQPKVTISQVAALIPASLRKSRYHLYLVEQARSWNQEPLYLWDEWVAYTNGAACGIEQASSHILCSSPPFGRASSSTQKTDFTWAVLEFSVYATYVAIAQQQLDPAYNDPQLLAFLGWNLERGMQLYHAGQQLDCFNWDQDQYLHYLQTSPDTQELRTFLSQTYGVEWTHRVFGFES